MSEVTSYFVNRSQGWRERNILPAFRSYLYSLENIEAKKGYEPLLVIGKNDGLWWGDDLHFILDRMSDGKCCDGDVLYAWANEIEEHPLKPGELREIVVDNYKYWITTDDADVSKDGLITNDCKPVKEEYEKEAD